MRRNDKLSPPREENPGPYHWNHWRENMHIERNILRGPDIRAFSKNSRFLPPKIDSIKKISHTYTCTCKFQAAKWPEALEANEKERKQGRATYVRVYIKHNAERARRSLLRTRESNNRRFHSARGALTTRSRGMRKRVQVEEKKKIAAQRARISGLLKSLAATEWRPGDGPNIMTMWVRARECNKEGPRARDIRWTLSRSRAFFSFLVRSSGCYSSFASLFLLLHSIAFWHAQRPAPIEHP